MIVEECLFDPVRDLQPVDQYGFVDLKTALDSGVVPSQVAESDEDYNGIDDPQKILGKPSDIFEAMDTQKALEQAASSAGEEKDDA